MLEIKKNITKYNRNVNNGRNIKYLVVHAVGAVSTAKNNADYFASKYIGSSAHYFCDDTSIWQSVDDKDTAWHCGTANCYTQKHPEARNANSIGIEMCQNTAATVSNATIANVAELVQCLMKKYNIPKENVIRHWDVVNKKCPSMYIDDGAWKTLKDIITGSSNTQAQTSIPEPVQATAPVQQQAQPDAPTPAPAQPAVPNGSNVNILHLQQSLNADGFTDSGGNRLAEDGIWGSKTESAVNKVVLSTKTMGRYVNVTAWVQCRVGTAADGLYGNNTKTAVTNYQHKKGISADGIAGPVTVKTIVREYVAV